LNCKKFVDLVKNSKDIPRVLVIGSGKKGNGSQNLWTENELLKVGVDVYKSGTVDVVCDAHYLPFPDSYFEGVWIQAVLEHVVEPNIVVAEIHRVLKSDGVVYAETPFMQQVHEGAYDFTRYTVLGHRYLFRDFEQIDIGGNKGADVVLA
jgi:SAM-dependent methyltransferase